MSCPATISASCSSPCFPRTPSPLRCPSSILSPSHSPPSHPPLLLRPSCSCFDSLLCSSCLCSSSSSPHELRPVKNFRSFPTISISDSCATPRSFSASTPMPPTRASWKGGHSVAKQVSQCNSAERVRSVLGIRDDNHVNALGMSRSDSHAIGVAGAPELMNSREQSRHKIASVRGKEDRQQDRLLKGAHQSVGSSPLKRKRPPKLDIPECPDVVPPGDSQLAEEQIEEVNVEGSHFGVSCKKGRREVMEDAHRVIPKLQGNPKQAFFGVFDGHGGRKAVDFVAENLAQNIVDAIDSGVHGEDYIEKAVSAAYLATDAEFLQKSVSSGASASTALVRDGYLVVANAGDCRAVMSRGGKAEALTNDHKAGREDERQRIESLGGYVDCFNGVWRVQGVLAVSRGFGDSHLKEWISAEPEVKKLPITLDCEFLILASDGLWDKVSNQEAVDCVKALLESHNLETPGAGSANNSSPSKSSKVQKCGPASVTSGNTGENGNVPRPAMKTVVACKKLVEMAANRGGTDDVSVVIAHLQHFR